MIIHYAWARCWIPGGQGYPTDFMGFPADPSSDYYRFNTTRAVPFSVITDCPYLILLGDPGLGKTTAMKEAFTTVRQSVQAPDTALFVNLGEYGGQSDLIQEVFKCPAIEQWKTSDSILHLFLDSLDEGRLHIKTIAKCLVTHFRLLPVERMRLRIACRSAEWPESLTRALEEIWKKGRSGLDDNPIYQLVPLHQGDVSHAAQMLGINAEFFLEAIQRSDLVPLAMRPVTLLMLLDIFKREGGLPTSKWEVYEKGCRRLCEESEERKDGGVPANLSTSQKLDLAGHVFFHQLFSNKAFIWRGSATAIEAEQGLPEDVILGDVPLPNGESIQIAPNDLREVLNVGLFARQGENRQIPAHQTYAEFLACRHFLRFNPPREQMVGLLFGSDGHLVPQLQELAGWLVGKRPDILEVVIKCDPNVLLRGDLSSCSAEVKSRIVDSLLSEVNRTQIEGHWNWSNFEKLSHPNLEAQLRPWVGKEPCAEARGIAMIIARQCKVTGLSDLLTQVALDQTDDYRPRIRAALTLVDIGSSEAKRALRPLAFGKGGADPREELKGYALKALWPDNMTAEELFGCLTPPCDESFMGSYDDVLRSIPDQLSPEHYPQALMWVARRLPHRRTHYIDIARKILTGASSHLHHDEVFDAFMICITRLQCAHHEIIEHIDIISTLKEAIAEHKRTNDFVFGKCLECVEAPERLYFPQICRLWKTDTQFAKAVELYQAETDDYLRPVLGVLASGIFSVNDRHDMELILNIIEKDDFFARKFGWLKDGCFLTSDEAVQAKQDYYKWGEGRERKPKKTYQITEQDFRAVFDIPGIGHNTWVRLRRLLTFMPNQRRRFSPFEVELQENHVWQTISPDMRSLIYDAAVEYVEAAEPTKRMWLETDSYTESDHYGIDALKFLCTFSEDVLRQVPPKALERWLPDVIRLPIWGDKSSHMLHSALIQTYMTQLPAQTVAEIQVCLQRQASLPEGFLPEILICFRDVWTPELTDVVINIIEDRETKPKYAMILLDQLAQLAPEVGIKEATRVFLSARQQGQEANETAIAAASVLVDHSQELNWTMIWAEVVKDGKFGNSFVYKLAHSHRLNARPLSLLTVQELLCFYYYLFSHYPNSEDPKYGEDITPRHRITDLKRYILEHLTRRATRESVEALEEIRKHTPELDWVRYHVVDARYNLRQSLWNAPTSEVLNKLLRQPDGVFVQNGEHLVQIVLRQLKAIEERLQGHTPQARFLWNENDPCSPKTENDFSDYVKSELEQSLCSRGIILNREVEIRRVGKGLGERVDIHIDAFTRRGKAGELDRIKVIVEVKGCWHKELETSMKEQLLERYMQESDCQFGIYLVGWFKCVKWSASDYRLKLTSDRTIEAARDYFTKQAAGLSDDQRWVYAYVMDTRLC